MKTKFSKTAIVVLLSALAIAGCNKEKEELYELDGYIVGYEPCSVNHYYQIGYIVISADLKDTLMTYSLSDSKYKMPASILGNSADTLYKIPESYFKNSWGPMFQISSRYDFKIKGKYRYAKDYETPVHLCTDDVMLDFEKVIITSATK